MKKVLYLLLGSSMFFISCSKDDEVVIPIVGLWTLDKITISEPPSGYQFASSTTPSATALQESNYEIEFLADMTYERTLDGTIFGRVDDQGTWELDGEDLDLDQEDATNYDDLPVRFEVDGDISDRSMTLITTDAWFAWPPSIINDPNNPLDTIDFSNSAEANAFFSEYGEIVDATFTLEFDKEN